MLLNNKNVTIIPSEQLALLKWLTKETHCIKKIGCEYVIEWKPCRYYSIPKRLVTELRSLSLVDYEDTSLGINNSNILVATYYARQLLKEKDIQTYSKDFTPDTASVIYNKLKMPHIYILRTLATTPDTWIQRETSIQMKMVQYKNERHEKLYTVSCARLKYLESQKLVHSYNGRTGHNYKITSLGRKIFKSVKSPKTLCQVISQWKKPKSVKTPDIIWVKKEPKNITPTAGTLTEKIERDKIKARIKDAEVKNGASYEGYVSGRGAIYKPLNIVRTESVLPINDIPPEQRHNLKTILNAVEYYPPIIPGTVKFLKM